MSTETATPTNRRNFKSILRENVLIKAVRRKTVQVREELNQYFLITPRRPSPPPIPPRPPLSSSLPPPMNQLQVKLDESLSSECWKRRHVKIKKCLQETVKQIPSYSDASKPQRIYFDKLCTTAEAKIMTAQNYSTHTLYDYLKKAGRVDHEMWSQLFAPSSLLLTEINSAAMAEALDWLRKRSTHAVQKQQQRLSKGAPLAPARTRRAPTATNALVVLGDVGSGKSSLVSFVAEHLAMKLYELTTSNERTAQTFKKLHERAIIELHETLSSEKSKNSADQLIDAPILFIDDADVYYDADPDYIDSLCSFVRSSELPLVLTVTSAEFLEQLEEQLAIDALAVTTIRPSVADIVFQIRHFICACFVPELSNDEIRVIVEAHKGDIRATLNAIQCTYSKRLLPPIRAGRSDVSSPETSDSNQNSLNSARHRRKSSRLEDTLA